MEFFKTSLGKTLVVLFCLFLAVGIVSGIVSASTTYHSYQKDYRNTITVNATDKVIAKPDIASISISVVSRGKTVNEVTTDGNKKMTDIVAALKAMQIDDKDIQTTSYYLTPEQDYSIDRTPAQAPKIIGYSLNQTATVKVRKIDQVGEVVQKATSLGANEVGNINLTIDDQDKLQDQTREKAFTKAKEKAATLARQAGVQLGGIIGFNDDSSMPYYDVYSSYKGEAMNQTVGDAAMPAPSFETGSEEVHASVSITYEIY